MNYNYVVTADCRVGRLITFGSDKEYTDEEVRDITLKLLEQDKVTTEKFNPSICWNVYCHTDINYEVTKGEE